MQLPSGRTVVCTRGHRLWVMLQSGREDTEWNSGISGSLAVTERFELGWWGVEGMVRGAPQPMSHRATPLCTPLHTLILSLWLSFQFHKTLFAKHNTQQSNRNYSFSQLLKHFSWNDASFLQNSKHKSITSNSIPQTSYIQVKIKLSTQNNSILLKKTNFAIRHDTQTLKNTHTLQFYTPMRWIQNNTTKTSNKCCLYKKKKKKKKIFTWWTQQMYAFASVTVEYSTKQQTTTKIIILPQHPVRL